MAEIKYSYNIDNIDFDNIDFDNIDRRLDSIEILGKSSIEAIELICKWMKLNEKIQKRERWVKKI